MPTSPRYGFDYLEVGETVPSEAVNEALERIEAGGGHFIFKDRDVLDPTALTPAAGDTYLIAGTGAGDWTGKDNKIAYRLNTSWIYITVIEGFTAWVCDENILIGYDGSSWGTLALGVGSAYTPGGTDVALADGGTGASLADPNADRILFWDDSAGAMTWLTVGTGLSITGTTLAASSSAPTESIILAPSDETTALTTGTAKITFRMPYAFTVTGVRCSLTTAQTSGSTFTVDINEGGTTILSTKLTIDNGEKTSTTAVTAAVISDSSLADDAEITVDIDQIGDGTAKGLKVVLIGHQ